MDEKGWSEWTTDKNTTDKLLQEFVLKFVEVFESQIKEDKDVLDGKIKKKTLTGKFIALSIQALFTITEKAFQLKGLSSQGRKIAEIGQNFIDEKIIKAEACRLEQFHDLETRSLLRKLLVISACSIFQNYEQQFTSVYVENKKRIKAIQELAEHAVNRIFNYYNKRDYRHETISSEIIIEGFLKGNSSKNEVKQRIVSVNKDGIKTTESRDVKIESLLNKPGLIVKNSNDTKTCDYFVSNVSRATKYGYRCPFSREEINDSTWKTDSDDNEFKSYQYATHDPEHWRKILKSINKKDETLKGKGVTILFGVKEPLPHFTGRDEQLIELDNFLGNSADFTPTENNKNTPIIAVTGLGGIGKTEFLRKYLSVYRHDHVHCIWLDATTLETLKKSLFEVIKNNKLLSAIKIVAEIDFKQNIIERDIGDVIRDVYDHLSYEISLIILDNVIDDTSESIKKFIGVHNDQLCHKQSKPSIIITSRYKSWPNEFKEISLQKLKDNEANIYIEEYLKISNDSTEKLYVSELAKTLNNFPLGLQQAVSYIKSEKKTSPKYGIKQFLETFKKERKEPLNSQIYQRMHSNYADINVRTTWITWEVTIDRIKNLEHGKIAIKILEIMSCFSSNDIPRDIFNNVKDFSVDVVKSAVDLLVSYSMINSEVEGQLVISIHNLVQEVTYLKLTQPLETLRIALYLIKNYRQTPLDDKHLVSIWEKASKFPKLIRKYCHCQYGSESNSPLHLLAKNGAYQAVEEIINCLINNNQRNIIRRRNQNKETILHHAVLGGNVQMIKYLLDKVDPNIKNKIGWSSLHFAVYHGDENIVETLLNHNRIDIELKTSYEFTPLHLCARIGNEEITEILMKKLEEKINKESSISPKTKWEFTPLHLACRYNHIGVVNILLKKLNAHNLMRCLNLETNYGLTALHFATEKGHMEIINLLAFYKAEMRAKDRFNNTPFMNITAFINDSYTDDKKCMKTEEEKQYFEHAHTFKQKLTNFKVLNNLFIACREQNLDNICSQLNETDALEKEIKRLTDDIKNYTEDLQELYSVESLVGYIMAKVCGTLAKDIEINKDFSVYDNIRTLKNECNLKKVNLENGK